MTTLNYGSTSLNPELDEHFEQALETCRTDVPEPLTHVVGGEIRREGDVFDRRDPSDPSRVVARAHASTEQVVGDAVAAARRAAPGWRPLSYVERAAALRASKKGFVDDVVEIAATISAETGKSRIEALAEAQESVDLIEHYCAQIELNDGFVTPLRPTATDTTTDVLRPYGVFGILAPFNFPAASALAAAREDGATAPAPRFRTDPATSPRRRSSRVCRVAIGSRGRNCSPRRHGHRGRRDR